MAGKIEYSEEQQAAYCALAQDIGIGRAARELGYPKSWASGIKWMQARGIKPNVDQAMQNIKKWHTFYEAEDLMVAIDNLMAVVEDRMLEVTDADDIKKLAEAIQKLVNTRLLLEGKATNISEKREITQQDLEIAELLREQKAMNMEKKETVTT